MVLLLTRNLLKLQQDWYRCRALAESVKTLTWRYIMGAAPFASGLPLQDARAEFRNQLYRTFDANRAAADKNRSQLVRSRRPDNRRNGSHKGVQPRCERKQYYAAHRLNDQRTCTCTRQEKITGRRGIGSLQPWSPMCWHSPWCSPALSFPDWQYFWGIGPIIVFASSVIGWMQVKKFITSYGGLYGNRARDRPIKPPLDAVGTESDFSDFINDAELAFTREHTLWNRPTKQIA